MEFTVRLLHLDDNARDAALIQTMLRKDGLTLDVYWVKNREDFDSALRPKKFDLVLCDDNIPAFDGKHALELSLKRNSDTPFIFVSGTLREDRAFEALRPLHRYAAAYDILR